VAEEGLVVGAAELAEEEVERGIMDMAIEIGRKERCMNRREGVEMGMGWFSIMGETIGGERGVRRGARREVEVGTDKIGTGIGGIEIMIGIRIGARIGRKIEGGTMDIEEIDGGMREKMKTAIGGEMIEIGIGEGIRRETHYKHWHDNKQYMYDDALRYYTQKRCTIVYRT
jgi:hypothetical protein